MKRCDTEMERWLDSELTRAATRWLALAATDRPFSGSGSGEIYVDVSDQCKGDRVGVRERIRHPMAVQQCAGPCVRQISFDRSATPYSWRYEAKRAYPLSLASARWAGRRPRALS